MGVSDLAGVPANCRLAPCSVVTAVALPPETQDVLRATGASAEQKQVILVLRISKRPKGVSGHPAISSKDVEVAIVPKKQLAPIVIGGWFFDLQDYPKER